MKKPSITGLTTQTFALCTALIFASIGMSAEKDTLNDADVKFVKEEAASSKGVVRLAELGVQKAVRAEVKEFAQMLVTDHTKAHEELTQLAATKGVELSATLDPKHAEKFQKLEKHSATDFDQEFLSTIKSGHEKCVANFEDAANDARDNDLKLWATTTLPLLRNHLAKAKELSSGSTTSVSTSTTKAVDNTERNIRDRDKATLTPINQGTSQADVNTTAQIRKEIIANENMSVNAKNVKIITNAGKVTLRGPVNTEEEKRAIGEIATRVASAENVDDQLEVKVQTTSK